MSASEDHVLSPVELPPEIPKKRLPKYGGPILYQGRKNDDWWLPSTLTNDAVYFIEGAVQAGSDIDRLRYLRTALLTSFASLEAFLNQLAFAQRHHSLENLGTAERDVMEEKETVLRNGMFERRNKLYSTEERFLFFYHYFKQKKFDKGTSLWQGYLTAKELRDSCTHPKPPFDMSPLTQDAVEKSFDAIQRLLQVLIEPPYQWMKTLAERRSANRTGN